MTRERREDLLLIALGVSLGLHILLMLFVKSCVLTHGAPPRTSHKYPSMRITRAQPRPEVTMVEAFENLAPMRDAPSAKPIESLISSSDDTPKALNVAPEPLTDLSMSADSPAPEITPTFSLPSASSSQEIPKLLTHLEASTVSTRPSTDLPVFSPPFGARQESSSFVPPTPVLRVEHVPTAPISNVEAAPRKANFTPASEVYAEVNEKIIADEKESVRVRITSLDAKNLNHLVDCTFQTQTDGKWLYYKVSITPRAALRPVQKDIVLLLDASGSIGYDRLGSIRKAAKRILRTATNSGDRFNLVAFRDRFTYAFRRWQTCTRTSFENADQWLNNLAAHGRTDVFSTISSVLTLPRDPTRPLIALVVTDGDANEGVHDNANILSRFTALNDGLISVYMYGVKSASNRELIDALTHGNRGESLIFEGFRWNAGDGMETLSECFRDPVLSDLKITPTADQIAETYPRRLRNLYYGKTLSFLGRVQRPIEAISFSLSGLAGSETYEGLFRLPITSGTPASDIRPHWVTERALDARLK